MEHASLSGESNLFLLKVSCAELLILGYEGWLKTLK